MKRVPKYKQYQSADHVRLIFGGNDYFDTLVNLLDQAQDIVHFQTYIYDSDATGQYVTDALIRASRRGVEVYMLIDAYGSMKMSAAMSGALTEAGVHLRFFAPFFSRQNIYIGRRLHQKIVVIDGIRALIGGINISDRYRGNEQERAWLDYAVLIEGELCHRAEAICRQLFGKRFRLKPPPMLETVTDLPLVRFMQNDWLRRKNHIYLSYVRAVNESRESVYILSSYFLPGRSLKKAIERATRRGVRVVVILPGISDVPLFRLAVSQLYSWLQDHKVEIYEWTASVLHGKIAVVDQQWSSIGSFNLNLLSIYGNIELNAEIRHPSFGQYLTEHLESILTEGTHRIIESTPISFSLRIRRWFAYHLVRISLRFLALFPNIGKFYFHTRSE